MLKLNSNLPYLKLSEDPAEGGTLVDQTTIEQDPFSQAADQVDDPVYPVLVPDRIITMECKSAKVEKVKGTEYDQLVIQLKTIDDQPTMDNKIQRAGLVGTIRIPISVHNGYTNASGNDIQPRTVEAIKADVALATRAFFGPGAKQSARDIFLNPGQYNACQAKVRVGHKKATSEFPEGNTFKFVSVKKA